MRPQTPAMIAAGATASGLTGLVPVGRLRGWQRAVVSVAEAPLVGFVCAWQRELPVAKRLGLAALSTAALATGKNLAIVLDRTAERWLVARGCTHPRLVIGGVSAVVGAVSMARPGQPSSGAAPDG